MLEISLEQCPLLAFVLNGLEPSSGRGFPADQVHGCGSVGVPSLDGAVAAAQPARYG